MNNFEFLDILTILSFIVGIQNLSLNEQQVNNLQEHLNKQDTIMLEQIISMLNEILAILKERK